MSEDSLRDEYLEILDKDFLCEKEVLGTHFSGKRMRIDAVIKPREPELWKNQDVAFGIEFKDDFMLDRTFDTVNFTKWLAQCMDYSHTEFDGYGYIFIFVCPELVSRVALGREHHFLVNLMSQLGIGELKEHKRHGLSLMLSQDHRMWSEKKGVESGKRWKLERKFGRR